MTDLAAITLAILNTIAPVNAPRETLPGWDETHEARSARYASIAADIAAVAIEACGERESCRQWSVVVMLGISKHESEYAPDVDAGRCWRGLSGHGPRCDYGKSHSIFQIRTGGDEAALFDSDRHAAAKAALRHATRSWNACSALEPALRLSAYAGGTCTNPEAQIRSGELWRDIQRALRAWPRADLHN